MTQLPTPSKPESSPESQRFFDAAGEGRFELPRCNDCQHVIWYPREFCPECGGTNVSWFEASGTGEIYSFTVVERGQGKWREHSPYVLAYVELTEGPRMMTNIIDVDVDDVTIGQAVSVRFDAGRDEGAMVRFGPA